jgi:hypothetical protein
MILGIIPKRRAKWQIRQKDSTRRGDRQMRRQLYHEINRLRAVDLKLPPLCRSVFADALLRLVVIEEPDRFFFDFDRVECRRSNKLADKYHACMKDETHALFNIPDLILIERMAK